MTTRKAYLQSLLRVPDSHTEHGAVTDDYWLYGHKDGEEYGRRFRPSKIGGGGGGGFPSAGDLRSSTATGGTAITSGALTAGDGGGGEWYWDPASTEPDNTGTVIVPAGSTGPGRWKRFKEDAVYLEWFGIQEYPVRITQQWNDAMVYAWKSGINKLTVKSAKKLCLVEGGCCSNVEVDLKWSKVYPPPDYKDAGTQNKDAASRIIGHAVGANYEDGSTSPVNLMNPTTYVGEHRWLYPDSNRYAGTLWERMVDGKDFEPGVNIIWVDGVSQLQPGDRIVIFYPWKTTFDQATAEYNIVVGTHGGKVWLEWPTSKFYRQNTDPTIPDSGIGRFPENNVLENFTLRKVIFPEIQPGANDAFVAFFSSRTNINVTIEDVICNYGRTAWFFVKGAKNRINRVVLDPQGKTLAGSAGGGGGTIPDGLAFEQGHSYLEVQDSVFNNVSMHSGEGGHWAFRRCSFLQHESPDGTGGGNSGATDQGSTGTIFEDCQFTNNTTLLPTRVVTRDGRGNTFCIRNRARGQVGSIPFTVLGDPSVTHDAYPIITVRDCDFDVQMSPAAFAQWPGVPFDLSGKFYIENTKYTCRLPKGETTYPVPTYTGLFGATDITKNAPMTDKHRDSAFVNSLFTCFGDEYGFSQQFVSWQECAYKPSQSIVWNAPGIRLVAGSADIVWTTFPILNDWSGPSTIWVEPVFVNPARTTGNLNVYSNGAGYMYDDKASWGDIFPGGGHQYTLLTLTGAVDQRVCIHPFRQPAKNGIMSGGVHIWVQFNLGHAETTITDTVYLAGFHVYTFGGR